jgi:alpha-tubulin suppressor-like RCC1 family protein
LCDVLPINNETYTEDLKLLIKRILSKYPLSRPSAKEILKDNIFHDRSKEYDMRIERLNVIARNRQISSNMPQNTVIASKTFECLVWGGGKLKPKPIEKFQGDHAPLQVSLGPSHFAVITIEKELFTWAVSQGESRFLSAKLGHGKSYGYTRSPKQVDALSGTAIEQVSCGDDFTCCVSSNGDVYTFGTDYMGCLGKF